jgi:archaellum component FlaC
LNLLKDKGVVEFSFDQLNQYMINVGAPQFDYESLKNLHDNDTRIANIVKDFTDQSITLKTSEVDDLKTNVKKRKNTVKNMAKKAVDLKDL